MPEELTSAINIKRSGSPLAKTYMTNSMIKEFTTLISRKLASTEGKAVLTDKDEEILMKRRSKVSVFYLCLCVSAVLG